MRRKESSSWGASALLICNTMRRLSILAEALEKVISLDECIDERATRENN